MSVLLEARDKSSVSPANLLDEPITWPDMVKLTKCVSNKAGTRPLKVCARSLRGCSLAHYLDAQLGGNMSGNFSAYATIFVGVRVDSIFVDSERALEKRGVKLLSL